MRKALLLLIPLGVLGSLIAWRLSVRRSEAAEQVKAREMRRSLAPAVAVAEASVRDIVRTFAGVGSIEAPLDVRIASKVSGRIDYLQVREGDRVTQGQVLVRIDPSEVEAAVRREEAALAEARSRLAQAEITRSATITGISTGIQQERAAVATAEAMMEQARDSLAAQEAAAQATVTEAQGRVEAAQAAIGAAESAIRSAQANLENARARFNRVNDLYRQGFIAAQEVDDARTAVNVQEAAVESARSQLSSARAQRDSAAAQKQEAQKQLELTRVRGRSEVKTAEARVRQARAALEQARANIVQRPAYEASLRALRASVTAAQAAVKQAEARRADTVLKAPLTGYVTGRHMDPGSMATPGQPILSIQAIRQVWVNVPVPEDVTRKLRNGMPAEVRVDALPGRTFAGRVVQVNPAGNPQTRQFTVRIGLDNSHNLLKPGMFARVTIITERIQNAVVVPSEAIQRTPKGPEVAVVDGDNQATRRTVTLGASDEKGTQITRGLQPGERVVILSVTPVRDGTKVRVAGDRN